MRIKMRCPDCGTWFTLQVAVDRGKEEAEQPRPIEEHSAEGAGAKPELHWPTAQAGRVRAIVLVSAVVAAVLVGWFLIGPMSDRDGSIPALEEGSASLPEATEPARPEPILPAGAAAEDPTIVWHKLSLVMVARERCWIAVSVDGEPATEVTLDAGERGEFEAEEQFTLDVGSGGAVELYLNGEPLGTAGEGRGLVEDLVVTAEGIVP
jgi:hypothetical protein